MAEQLQQLKDSYRWDSDDISLYDRQCPGRMERDFYRHAETILTLLDPRPGEVGLNVGCGAGRVEFQWADRVGELHGVDFSATMIKQAREHVRFPNVHFYENDGRSLSMFRDDTFDFAWCELVFQHVPKDITAGYVHEVHRVLRPDGRFVCQIPRVEKYGDAFLCGGMSEDEVAAVFRVFSRVAYPEAAIKRDYYIIPLVVK